MYYFLMNKDNVAARLEIESGYIEKVEQVGEYLPYGFGPGLSWIDSRRVAGERGGMGYLMRKLRLDRRENLLADTHLVSLNDTFWVRAEDDELSWADVSPYSNLLDPALADAFFGGPGWFDRDAIQGRKPPSNSPELATGGQYPKCWERGEDGQIRLYKAGAPLYRGQGPEPYSEALTAQMLAAAGIDHVPYTLAERNGKLASVCPLFTSEDVGFVPARAFFDDLYTVGDLLDLAAEFGSEELWREMVVVDALTANVDRHDRNWGFLVDNETGEVLRMAPLYDHNLALAPGLVEDGNDLEEYLARLTPRIGSDFVSMARAALSSAIRIREKLERLWEFEFDPGCGCPEWRVDASNKLLKRQLKAILE